MALSPRWLFAVWAVVALGVASWAGIDLVGGRAAPSAPVAAAQALHTEGLEVFIDSDNDGLADAIENFGYGSDPRRASTTGIAIPDGWLARYGHDPSRPALDLAPAAVPPADELPAVYAGGWPAAYSWTLLDAYSYGRPANWDEATQGPWDNRIDPREWRGASGLPAAWLHHYGLDPTDASITTREANDGFTVADDYRHDTDPGKADSDGDGLSDADEVNRHRSDPRRFSTLGSTVPDGWLVRFGFDPRGPDLSSSDPAHKGMSLAAVYEYGARRLGAEAAIAGGGLDPRSPSTLGLPIPDGWLVGHGLDPLDAGVAKQVLQRAPDNPGAPASQALLPELVLTVFDAYAYGRPANWTEADDGPWPGGLDPRRTDQDSDGVGDALELRGWWAQRRLGLGPNVQPQAYVASGDPLLADTDGDGLGDGEERLGRALRGEGTYLFQPSDPRNPDTAFSGLSDLDKVLGLAGAAGRLGLHNLTGEGRRTLLEPAATDSDGDFLADGEEAVYWVELAGRPDAPYAQRFAGSALPSLLDGLARLPRFNGRVPGAAEAAGLLQPQADLDADGRPNLIDADADADGLADGLEVKPALMALTDLPTGGARHPVDPANPDTDGDGLPDFWEVQNGQHSAARQAWDLDPSRYRSDGITPDGQANLDGDGADWVAIAQGEAQPRRFEFTNFLEYRAGADPHRGDQDGDGLEEGWAFFWGQVYPSVLAQAEAGIGDAAAEVGEVRPPGGTQFQESKARLANPLAPGLAAAAKDEAAYTRFVEAPVPALDTTLLDAGSREEFRPPWPRVETVVRGSSTESLRIASIDGVHRQTFALDEDFGLNPYLDDTDGDGIRDSVEARTAPCPTVGTGTADPAVPDADDDPDQDGLANGEEAEADIATNPCLADSDLGGLADGVDAFFDPLDPSDDAEGRAGDDSDGDGLLDSEEILDGSSPLLPDTDRDGLLDGFDLTFQRGFASADADIAAFEALGVAHRSAGDAVTFLGERSQNTDARDPHTRAQRIPDGWMAYYGTSSSTGLDGNYACNRPAWWAEARHGVWWWGVRSTSPAACTADMDRDGLNDRNGADPVPAASHGNLPNRTLGVLPQAAAAVHAPLDDLRLAQGWGECAGDPVPCRAGWSDPAGRAGVDLVDLSQLPAQLLKEEPQTLAGRLLVACSGSCPVDRAVANRAVLVRLHASDGPGAVAGLGFTEDDGSFSVPYCLCAAGQAQIPVTGIVAQGQDRGPVAWTMGAAALPIGSVQALDIEVLATTATFYGDPSRDPSHPQHDTWSIGGVPMHATAGLKQPLGSVTVASAGNLTVAQAPASVPWQPSRTVPVAVRLTDASGGALPERPVQVRLGALVAPATTGPDGVASVVFELPDSLDGVLEAGGQFAGEARVGPAVAPGIDIVLQRPTALTLGDVPGQAASGSSLAVPVHVTRRGAPLADTEVRATLGGNSGSAKTDADGKATIEVAASGLGPQTLRVQIPATPLQAGAEATRAMQVLGGTTLRVSGPATASPGQPLRLTGLLHLSDGTPLAREVDLGLDGAPFGQALSRPDGTIGASPLLPASLAPGPHRLTARFAGVAGELLPAEDAFDFLVSFPVRLDLPPTPAARGTAVSLLGNATVAGAPMVGALVNLAFDDQRVGQAVTMASGAFQLQFTVPANVTLGPHRVEASYNGSSNGTYAPARAQAVLLVGTDTVVSLVLPDTLQRGANPVSGSLRLADGAPAADRTIQVSWPGVARNATSGPDGRFSSIVTLGPSQSPGLVEVLARFAGNDTLAPSSTSAKAPFRVATRLHAVAPPEAGRGATYTVEVALLDDLGAFRAGTVRLTGFGLDLNWSLDAKEATVDLPVPADWPLGGSPVWVSYSGDDEAEPAAAELDPVVKDHAGVEIGPVPRRLRPDQPFEVVVRVLDGAGDPVPDASVGLLQVEPGILVVATTNATGHAAFALTAPRTGTLTLQATFGGTPDLAIASATAASVRVAAPSSPASWLALAALAAVLAAGAAILVRRQRRNRPAEAVRGILEEADRRIVAGDPWTAAVLLAARRLSDHLATLGFHERDSESIRDFASDLAKATGLPAAALVQFVQMAEWARYGGPAGPGQARMARAALQEILNGLRLRTVRGGGR